MVVLLLLVPNKLARRVTRAATPAIMARLLLLGGHHMAAFSGSINTIYIQKNCNLKNHHVGM